MLSNHELITGCLGLIECAGTSNTYAGAFRTLANNLGDRHLTDLDIDDFVALKRDALASGLSPAYVRVMMAAWRKLTQYTQGKLRLAYDPMKGLSNPTPIPVGTERRMTLDEACKIIRHLDMRTRDGMMALFLLETGARNFEAAKVTWGDVTDRKLTVTGKGKWTGRVIMSDEFRQVLEWYRDPWLSNTDLIFPSRKGDKPMRNTSIDRIISTAAIAVGLPDVTPHWFRHTAITVWIANGMSRDKVIKNSRHRDGRMIDSVYLHVDDDE